MLSKDKTLYKLRHTLLNIILSVTALSLGVMIIGGALEIDAAKYLSLLGFIIVFGALILKWELDEEIKQTRKNER